MMPRFRVASIHPGADLQCRSYLVLGPEAPLLVDPGSGLEESEILSRIGDLGFQPADISHALLTHCHVDHALGADRFRRFRIQLVATPSAASELRTGSHRVWYEHPERVRPVPIDITPADGERLLLSGTDVRVLHTPGHTADCATYLIRSGEQLLAFTGDLLMPDARPGWTGSDGFSRPALIQSLRKVLQAVPDRVYPGHSSVVGDPREWLRRGIRLLRA
jgi:glyoxylase-like metal-dependent hydrolase (beta-lactamase superfamily II)